MIEVLLCSMNARYVHTCLAVRSLAAYVHRQQPIEMTLSWREWTINDRLLPVLADLDAAAADVYAFSCYIWNITPIIMISRELKKIRPQAIIIWGGPEASTRAAGLMTDYPFVDYLIQGEGEKPLTALLRLLSVNRQPESPDLADVAGLVWREAQGFRQNSAAPLLDGSDWAFPYADDELQQERDRIHYYESSRGCPFNCSYCLSSRERTVRYRPLPLVYAELARFIKAGVRQVKFVDRTFNCDPQRARAIWQFLLKESTEDSPTGFHFELAGDLLDDASLQLLDQAPPGLFQFEIGVQSAHADVLASVNRVSDLDRLSRQVERLSKAGNSHIHLDLIAGLPGESLDMFGQSFDFICHLRPHTFQLGFLKILPGTAISRLAAERGYKWLDEPPYEVLRSDQLSFRELSFLKKIDSLLSFFINSEQTRAAALLAGFWPRPWLFYLDLAAYFQNRHLFDRDLSVVDRLLYLYEFARERIQDQFQLTVFLDLLRTDYQLSGAKGQPVWMSFWENSTNPDHRRRLRSLRLAARLQTGQERIRLHFDLVSFDWSVYTIDGRIEKLDYLMVYDDSNGSCRLAGHGAFGDGLPPLQVAQK